MALEEFIWEPLTWEILQLDLQNAFKTTATLGSNRKAEIKEAHGGYVSQVVFITLDWNGKDVDDLPNKCVIKVTTSKELKKITEASLDREVDEPMMDIGGMISDNELNFYVHQRDWLFSDIPIPRFYCGRKAADEILAGYIALEWVDDIEAQYLYDCVGERGFLDILRTASKFHSKAIINPRLLEDIPENVPKKLNTQFITSAGIAASLDKVVEKAPSRVEQIEVLKKFVKIYDHRERIDDLRRETCPIELLCHGDLTQANVLWKRVDDELRLKSLHDWQMTHPGNPMTDLARLFALGLSSEALKNKRDGYLEIYFEELKKNSAPTEIPWKTSETLIESFERIFPLETVAVCALLVPFIPLMLRTCSEEKKGETEEIAMQKIYGALDVCEEFIIKWHQ